MARGRGEEGQASGEQLCADLRIDELYDSTLHGAAGTSEEHFECTIVAEDDASDYSHTGSTSAGQSPLYAGTSDQSSLNTPLIDDLLQAPVFCTPLYSPAFSPSPQSTPLLDAGLVDEKLGVAVMEELANNTDWESFESMFDV